MRRSETREVSAAKKQKKKKAARRAQLKPATKNRSKVAIPIAARDRRAGKWFEKLVALQARLRGPGGCPWDREQTHQSLRKFLIEETYEVLDAMSSGDTHHFSSELGDLLLQVIFHSILAEETGAFTISDVIESVHSKMVRRHPHVFGDVTAKDSKEVLKNWEQIKSEERAAKGLPGARENSAAKNAESILGDIPKSLPAALEAYQMTRRAARVGFDWDDLRGIFEKIDEEKAEILESLGKAAGNSSRESPESDSAIQSVAHLEEEVGDLLFAAVNVARFVGADPEIALKRASRKFQTRFQWMEAVALAEGRPLAELPRERMEELWNLSKLQQSHEAAHTK